MLRFSEVGLRIRLCSGGDFYLKTLLIPLQLGVELLDPLKCLRAIIAIPKLNIYWFHLFPEKYKVSRQ